MTWAHRVNVRSYQKCVCLYGIPACGGSCVWAVSFPEQNSPAAAVSSVWQLAWAWSVIAVAHARAARRSFLAASKIQSSLACAFTHFSNPARVHSHWIIRLSALLYFLFGVSAYMNDMCSTYSLRKKKMINGNNSAQYCLLIECTYTAPNKGMIKSYEETPINSDARRFSYHDACLWVICCVVWLCIARRPYLLQ